MQTSVDRGRGEVGGLGREKLSLPRWKDTGVSAWSFSISEPGWCILGRKWVLPNGRRKTENVVTRGSDKDEFFCCDAVSNRMDVAFVRLVGRPATYVSPCFHLCPWQLCVWLSHGCHLTIMLLVASAVMIQDT